MPPWLRAPILVVGFGCFIAAGCANAASARQAHLERGDQLAAKGDYASAAIEYRNAIQQDGKFGQARYRLALAYEHLGDWPQAAQEASRAADLMPTNDDVQVLAGQLLLAGGRYEDAASRARQVLARNQGSIDALMLLGRASAHIKDSDSALAALDQAVKRLPDEPRLDEVVGELQTARGDAQAAEGAFKRAVNVAPKSIEARQALATYYFATGRTAEAEQTLKQALPIDSGSALARELAVLYFLAGRDTEAESALSKILLAAPTDVSIRVALGDLYARHLRFDDALKTYEPLASAGTATFAPAVARMALVEYRANRKPNAYARLSNAAARAPKEADLPTMSARLLLADHRYTEAESAARVALQLQPNRFEALDVLGTALVREGKVDDALPIFRQATTRYPRAAAPKIALGDIYLQRGDTATALQFAQDAVNVAPGQPLARLLLVRVLTARRDVLGADRALQPLLQTYASSPQTQIALGDLSLLKGDKATAQRAYAKALELDPTSVDALSGTVNLDVSTNRSTDALALVRKSLAARPDDGPLLLLAARTYLAAKDSKDAEGVLAHAIKVAPSSSFEAYRMLAGIYFTEGQLDQAKAEYVAMTQQQPTAIGPSTMLGTILILQGKRQEAAQTYERLLQANPTAPVAANNLAMILLESGGNLDVALGYAQTAKRAFPTDADVNDTLGLVYLKKGLHSLAVENFEESTKSRPKEPVFWLHLGEAYVGAGQSTKARDALTRALSVDPHFSGADEARKALAGLKG